MLLLDKPECKKCAKVLQELENIDDEADQLGIGFVKINDEALAEEYNLGDLPALVYYRHQTPIIYEGKKRILSITASGEHNFRRANKRRRRLGVAGPTQEYR